MSGSEDGGIFLSYRRQESSHVAGRLYDRLADHFGEARVFMDVDTIEPGVDFVQAINRAVVDCQVLLAVIGPNWLTITDARGRRRLDDPDDIVRLEVQAALARDVRVIPILVEGAGMPAGDELPASLAGLVRRNAFTIRHESFRSDAERLIAVIEGIGREPAPRLPVTTPGTWRLELLDSPLGAGWYRLASEAEEYIIAVKFGEWRIAVALDGKRIGGSFSIGSHVFPVSSLSSRLGCLVTFEVLPELDDLSRRLIVRIGGQAVHCA